MEKDAELIDIRPDEILDTTRLEPFLRENLEGAKGPMEVAQFGGGNANLTYMIAFGENEFVLRRPPLGPVAPSAHDMKREHHVLANLYKEYPLAPRSFLLCEDHDIIGADFHMLERKNGIVIRATMPEKFAGNPTLNQRIGLAVVDALADLHSLDPNKVGLGDLGKPEGFVERQLTGWTKRWHKAKDADNPDFDRLAQWLLDTRQESKYTTLLHNDLKLDNMLLNAEDPGKAEAVLDWDMCTRGDPLMDLGNLLNYWIDSTDPIEKGSVTSMPTQDEGFPTRTDVVKHYTERTGFNTSNIDWYHAFGAFKLTVVIQQIYIRYLRGQTQDKRFADFGIRVRDLINKGILIAGI
ncbi:MAG: phosphotransferase family protein [Rhodospirillales bacterium]|nr:phosphotransferase family protein [Rhodospirillales bacterium]